MFKRIGTYFNNLSVGRKLAFGFGLLVFMTILLGSGSLITASVKSKTLEDLLWTETELQDAERIQENLLQARRHEKDYLLRNRTEGFEAARENYVVTNHQSVQEVLGLVEGLTQLQDPAEQSDQQDLANLASIKQAMLTYQAGFDTVVGLTEERGFQDTGLEGQFRDAAHTLEAGIGSDPELLVLLLQMRRHEKDYLLRGDPTYVEATQTTNAELQTAIRASELPTVQKTALLGQAETYLTTFNALVEMDTHLASETDAFREQAHLVEPIADQILSDNEEEVTLALGTYKAVERTSLFINIALVVLATMTGTMLAVIITRGITHQVSEIDNVFRAARVGDFDVRAKVLGKDELGRTADGVNALLEQLSGQLSDVQAAARSEIEQIFNTAADGMRLIDTGFNTIRANGTFRSMAGSEAFPDGDHPKCYNEFFSSICHSSQCTLTRIQQGESLIQTEVEKERPDGQKIPCFLIATPFYDADGHIMGVVEDFRDITAQKEAEEQIRSQNEALAAAVEDLRRVAVEVEATATDVTTASGSMHDIVQLMTGQAASSAEVAERAASSALEGDQAVQETIAAMSRIRSNTQETARRIKRLGEVSQEVGEAARLIEDLADRTTVLALNASIQAAAAGEAGRGFAVVAEEVQRLAERATGATRQIDQLITSIRAEANEAMVSVEQVTREVVDGSTLAQNAGEQMSTLNNLTGDLSNLIQHLTETTAAQTSQSLAVLSELTEGLKTSVAGFRMPAESYPGGNGRERDLAHS